MEVLAKLKEKKGRDENEKLVLLLWKKAGTHSAPCSQ